MKQILRVLFTLALLMGALTVTASAVVVDSGTCGQSVTWTLDSEGVLTISGSGEMDDYPNRTAPWYSSQDDIQTLVVESGVTSIGISAFRGCSNLTSITIPDSVTNIGSSAFYGCSSLTSVTIPVSVTSLESQTFAGCSSLTSITIPDSIPSIGESAFSNCSSLITVTIPDSVQSISYYAFSGCSSLSSVTIPDSVRIIAYGAFSGCSSLTSITIPDSIAYIDFDTFQDCSSLASITIPDSVTSIGDSAFRGCSNLTSITIPDSVTSIGSSAFNGCSSLTSITIPDSVLSIGTAAFLGCSSLTSITIPDSVTSIGTAAFSDCSSLTSIAIPDSVTSIDTDSLFSNCRNLTSVIIPESVTSIGDSAFYGCSSLTSITIPDSVTSIEYYAFWGCSNLTSITIPDSVTSIGAAAFRGCSSLTSTTIPNFVTSIGRYAFSGCSSLTNITIPDSVTSMGDKAFYDCDGLKNVTIGNGVTDLSGFSFRNNINLATIIIGNGITSIRDDAFSGCSGLTSVTIPNSVTSVGYSAFSGCSSLTNITIPDSVTSMGDNAFYDCDGLKNVTIGNGVACIGDSAFEGCSSLTSVTIPDSVTTIGWRAFQGCSGLTSIIIPDSVTSMGDNAFYDCDGLKNVTIGNGMTDLSGFSFSNNINLATIIIGNGITSIRHDAFSGCSGLTSVTIPNSVTSVGYSAFYGCSSLTSVTIPDSVTSIGYSAFYGCSSLTSITISDSVTSIEYYAFWGCSNLTSITIPDSVTSIGAAAFRGCSSLASTTIPNFVTSIGRYAFFGCSSLTNITIPDSVTSMGDNAFYDCDGLKNVTIGNGVACIGDSAFEGCNSLTSVTISNSVTSIGTAAFRDCSSLTDVYYAGTESEWRSVSGRWGLNATIHYNSTGPMAQFAFERSTYAGETNQTIYLWALLDNADEDISALADEISWTVDHPEVASILNMGKLIFDDESAELALSLRLHAPGTVTITGMLPDGSKAVCRVTVGRADGTQAVSMSDETLNLIKNQTSLIFASLAVAADGLTCTWSTSDPEVIAFDRNGLSTTDSVFPNGYTSCSQQVYCQGSGSAVIRCTLSTGEWAEQSVMVWDSITDTNSYTTSNSYNRNLQQQTGNDADVRALQEYRAAFINAYDTYAKAVTEDLKDLSKKEGFDAFETLEQQAKKMMQADAAHRYLSFPGKPSTQIQQAAYEGLCNMLYTSGVSKDIDFKNVINSWNEFDVSNSIVKKICSAIEHYQGTYLDSTGKYSVSINCFGFGGSYFGTMSVKAKQGGKTCDHIVICSSTVDASAMCAAYLNALRDLGDDAVLNVYSALAQDVFGSSLGKIADKSIQKHIKKLFDSAQSKLSGTGLDQLGNTVAKCVDYYTKCADLMKYTNLIQGTSLIDGTKKLNELVSYDLDSAPSATSAATKKAYGVLKQAQQKLTDALKEYYLSGKVSKQDVEQWSLWSIFQCPISITVYNSTGTQIGYVGEDDIWYSDDIYIEENGDTKIIYSTVGEPLTFSVSGTDDGVLNCTFEELQDGEPLGRVNYYDAWLTDASTYTVSLTQGMIRTQEDVVLSDAEDQIIASDEYLSAGMDARVRIKVLSNNAEAGTVIGDRDYARGDPVKLYAMENAGYVFAGWYDENNALCSASPCYEFTARTGRNLTAVFVERTTDENWIGVSDLYADQLDAFVERADDSLTLRLIGTEVDFSKISAVLAEYDANGKMLTAHTLAGTVSEEGVDYTVTNINTGKLLILDELCRPVLEVVETK